MLTQVLITEEELVNFFTEKFKKILMFNQDNVIINKEVKENEFGNEVAIFSIEFKDPVKVDFEKLNMLKKFNTFTKFLMKLGFYLVDIRTNPIEYTGTYKHWESIEEYMNADMIRIIMVLEEEEKEERRTIYVKKIIIGRYSMINCFTSRKVVELISKLEELEIQYKHEVLPGTQVIKIKGHIERIGSDHSLSFYHGNDKMIEVLKWNREEEKSIRLYNLFEYEIVTYTAPKDTSISYEDGNLYIMFFHKNVLPQVL